ncbi:hypothetical protein HR45_14740 [Shewanella mangrovi]|uniref:Uncharacterized protein n=1 Tax=Shewanella mangrovi TaxID=1515746 RepID=A0A094JBT3_9GAMM|nr:hypothetical protein [Shewanella mangrovi]KFZ36712.1 hypothetical protein HR45_14740 [Shewanella mangrovi]
MKKLTVAALALIATMSSASTIADSLQSGVESLQLPMTLDTGVLTRAQYTPKGVEYYITTEVKEKELTENTTASACANLAPEALAKGVTYNYFNQAGYLVAKVNIASDTCGQ